MGWEWAPYRSGSHGGAVHKKKVRGASQETQREDWMAVDGGSEHTLHSGEDGGQVQREKPVLKIWDGGCF